MVLTRGGHRSRPRDQTSTPARDGAGTSRAVAGHSPAQGAEAPPALPSDAAMMQSPASAAIPKEPQGSEPPSRRYHTRVGPRQPTPPPPPPPPSLLCIHDHPGPRLPSGPGHLAQGSFRVLSPSLRLLQLLRVHRLSYPRLRGLGVHYLAVARYLRT